jgi:murE/murF fusion protein
MTLRHLIDGLDGARLIGDGDVAVTQVRADSRAIAVGEVFVAIAGRTVDGHDFVGKAIERGAAAIVVEREMPGVAVPQVVVDDTEWALGVLTGRAMGSPAERMTLIGVTGTNGKTTATYLTESMLAAVGARTGVIGTVNYRWGGRITEAPYTTPTPETLHGALAGMVDGGCTHAVLEVTSSALAQSRLAGMRFRVAAFTNLTQDHLDVHGTMAAYRDAKRLLFTRHLADDGVAVVNIDDPEGDAMAAGVARVLRVSTRDPAADIAVIEQRSTVRGIEARIRTPRGELAIASRPLIGDYNVANLALVVGIGEALGLPHDKIALGIAALPGVPGRVERVANDAGLDVVVDYAHTPDALRNVLSTLRPLTERRLICVFGCGGDRDPTKRPKMGAVVAELADLAVVTSDNPRTEQPRAIIDAILSAVPRPFFVDADRRTAIRAAIAEATPGDIVVIAGKGHEDYQILGTTKIHFDDREEAAAAIAMRPQFHTARIASGLGGTADRDVVCPRVVIDGRIAAPGDLYVAIRGASHDGHAFCAQAVAAGATAVMIERGRRADAGDVGDAAVVEVDDTTAAIGGLARAHRERWDGVLVAVTGSSGKTTTKQLAAAALAAAGATHAAAGSLNNETGVPLTLLGLRAHHKFAVVEMGMRGAGQIEYLTRIAEPDVAVVVNAGTAHVELLGSTDAIAAAKAEIWRGLRPGGVIVRPADDPRLAALAPAGRTLTFGDAADADVRLVATEPIGLSSRVDLEVLGVRHAFDLPMLGKHNAIDACAALAAAIGANVPIDVALQGIARVRSAAMRGEVVDIAGRHVIVDCYNANPDSMAAALDMLAGVARGKKAVAVLGDMLELGAMSAELHRGIGDKARGLGVAVVALGEHRDALANAGVADDPDAAAARAFELAGDGDWILVKASRGMRLERVVDAMRRRAA